MPDIDIITYLLKTFFFNIFAIYTFFKLTNEKLHLNYKVGLIIIANVSISSLRTIIKYNTDLFMAIMTMFLLDSILLSTITKKQIGNTMIIALVSLGINYIVSFISIFGFGFLNKLLNMEINLVNDLITLFFISLIHIILLYLFFKIKRFKNGFTFLQRKNNYEYFNVLILNITVAILFVYIIFYYNFNQDDYTYRRFLFLGLIIFAFAMYLSIKNSLTLYYKQKLLQQELEHSNSELEKMKLEYSKLEHENLSFMEITHSIKHRLEALEHKSNTSIANDGNTLNKRIENLSKDYFNNIQNIRTTTELEKTNIEEIDDMFSYMNSECNKNNIDFNLQLSGNIHFMVNNILAISELETLIADHIRNAIIAISYSNSEHKSIIVKLGLFNDCYKLCIYDTGIEFELDTLINLGLKPATTHSDNDGTGIGFMNTFETLNKCKASLVIGEKKPSNTDYTKSIAILFDGQNKYVIRTYRSKELEQKNEDCRVKVQPYSGTIEKVV